MVIKIVKCKNCKEVFTPVRFNQKFCLESDCVRVWVESEKEKQWAKQKKALKSELETTQDLIKKAQKVFNDYIRARDRNKVCISCNRPLGAKFDAGHYFNANNHWSVRFDENNVHGQCVTCNQFKHGNLLNYQIGIQQRIGADELINLHAIAHETKKFTRDELREIISKYKEKLKAFD
jgi:hypothetical protein